MTSSSRSVSLVLGSGGARGLAHIGVIRELEASGYRIASIAGCSIGALIGGVYAAGKLDAFEHWVSTVTNVDILNLLDVSWSGEGLVKGDKIIATLVDLVGQQQVEDLPIPFTAVAADVANEKEVWLSSGSLFEAIRASISLPLFFTPVPYRDDYLVDGGVLNPVPIAPTFKDDTDLTIAVNLCGPVEPGLSLPKQETEKTDSSFWRDGVNRFIARVSNGRKASGETLGFYDIADQAFDAMQGAIARQKLAAYPPDKVIEIPRNACGMLEFDCAQPMIALGRERAQQVL